jgi:type II secretory pathway predicted ATPase ExeA
LARGWSEPAGADSLRERGTLRTLGYSATWDGTPLFEPAAIEALFQATSGLPRKVNLLAHHALMAAALAKAKAASAEHVQAALPEVG